jgi:hypothetical protein
MRGERANTTVRAFSMPSTGCVASTGMFEITFQ